MSRTIRKAYTGAKSIDPKCRTKNCYCCRNNHYHKFKKRLLSINEQLQEKK